MIPSDERCQELLFEFRLHKHFVRCSLRDALSGGCVRYPLERVRKVKPVRSCVVLSRHPKARYKCCAIDWHESA